jgi:hypothetical protein
MPARLSVRKMCAKTPADRQEGVVYGAKRW